LEPLTAADVECVWLDRDRDLTRNRPNSAIEDEASVAHG
jgi:hypothetical protein